ncbi:outer membrane-stress sensor serine endopeptidase DegS [Thorsellia anophelis]|uniref:Serine endoprotease DegS n=1 Tax=Thorsellia anophelis DSM 18579 TaxID=1123402 RepID=A0A1H9YYY6_9GAMM|nr:outer membrane-stress sensor serine endopeptidase DegS [Thorsellia anophelis]SES74416.1 serine protease DegS [Thorsellia anophelis DSM 18579]
MLIKLLKAIVLGAIVGILMIWLFPQIRTKHPEIDVLPTTDNVVQVAPISFHEAVNIAAPTVVYVYNRGVGDENDKEQLGIRTLGSGVVMRSDGYILTNMHVISGAEQIVVSLQNGSTFEAELVGADDLTDLAVLKIDAIDLLAIPVNLERKTRVGDVVLAIGNPYNLGVSITQGIISATGRISLSLSGRQNFLQTDAAINHGNSGGALVNSLGELVGINTLSFDKNEDGTPTTGGLNFAIPTELAIKVMNKIIKDGRVIRGYFGIKGGDVKMTSTDGVEEITGIYVSALDETGPAAKAGIRVGDVLIKVNNLSVLSTLDALDKVAEIAPGTIIPVVLIRDEYAIELQLTVGKYPEKESF